MTLSNTAPSAGCPVLPVEAYTSRQWFSREQVYLFGHTWQYAGMINDQPEAGDRLCVQAGAFHLLAVRAVNDRLRAFHALCRHRGTRQDLNTDRKQNIIICPYHNWTYDLEGQLIGVPDKAKFTGLDKEKISLHPAKTAVWKGVIFVHPDPYAEPFEEWLGTLSEKMGPHRPSEPAAYEEGRLRYEVKANWKLFAENYMDGCHLQYLHSETLNMYDHRKQSWSFQGPHWTFFKPLTADCLEWAQTYPKEVIPHIPQNQLGAFVHLLFPNFGITETESWWSAIQIIPKAPDRAVLEIRTWSTHESFLGKVSSWFGDSRNVSEKTIRLNETENPLESEDFMLEDLYICEKLQEAMTSPKYEVGPMAHELEGSVIKFQQLVSEHLNKHGDE